MDKTPTRDQRSNEKSKSDIHNHSHSRSPDIDKSKLKDMFYEAQKNLDNPVSSPRSESQGDDLNRLASEENPQSIKLSNKASQQESDHLLSSERTPLNKIPSESSFKMRSKLNKKLN